MERISVKDLTIGDIEGFTKALCNGEIVGVKYVVAEDGKVNSLEVNRKVDELIMTTQDGVANSITTFTNDETSPIGISVSNVYKVSRDFSGALGSIPTVQFAKETEAFKDFSAKYPQTADINVTDKFMVYASRKKMLDKTSEVVTMD